MPEIDTSSYPKPALPVNPLDVAGKVGDLMQRQQSLQSNALTIDKQKLDLVNQRFGEMSKGFAGLINDPDLNEDKVRQYTTNQVKLGYITPEMASAFIGTLPPTQSFGGNDATYKTALKQTLELHMQHAQFSIDAINFQYGQPGAMNIGNAVQPTVQSPKFGLRSTGLPIAIQQPPTQAEYDENNQPRYRGVQPSQAAPGMVTAPPPRGLPVGPVQSPAVPGNSANFGGTVTGATVGQNQPASVSERIDASFPRGGAAGPTPTFEPGLKAYQTDQDTSAARAIAIKPAIQALKLMPGLRTGPGTAQFTDLVAFAKAWGITDTTAEKDPTVLRQEIEKKLAQYVGGSPLAARSDAAQALAEAGSPNPKKQILPALMNLTRDAVALDRIQIAKPNAFSGQDYQNYLKHRSQFPTNIDERAFTVDLLPSDERDKLLNTMHAKYKKNPKDEEALKFFQSLDTATKAGIYR